MRGATRRIQRRAAVRSSAAWRPSPATGTGSCTPGISRDKSRRVDRFGSAKGPRASFDESVCNRNCGTAYQRPPREIASPIRANEQSKVRVTRRPPRSKNSTRPLRSFWVMVTTGPQKHQAGLWAIFVRRRRNYAFREFVASRARPWRAKSATARASVVEPFSDSGLASRMSRRAA
jgi:hypothetical protein